MLSSGRFARHFLGLDPVSFKTLRDSALFFLRSLASRGQPTNYGIGARYLGPMGEIDRTAGFAYIRRDKDQAVLASEYALLGTTRDFSQGESDAFRDIRELKIPEAIHFTGVYDLARHNAANRSRATQPRAQLISSDRWRLMEISQMIKGIYFNSVSIAAFAGFAPAQFECARSMWLSENQPLAIKLLRKAAEGGYSEAMYAYGRLRLDGKTIPRNPKMAYQYFDKAAKVGNLKAAFFQGLCLWDGVGVKKNEDEAVRMFTFVHQKGLREGKEALQLIDDWRKSSQTK